MEPGVRPKSPASGAHTLNCPAWLKKTLSVFYSDGGRGKVLQQTQQNQGQDIWGASSAAMVHTADLERADASGAGVSRMGSMPRKGRKASELISSEA